MTYEHHYRNFSEEFENTAPDVYHSAAADFNTGKDLRKKITGLFWH